MTAKEELWNSGYDESVEVNQRALIDKVLARYSAEFTVFRELLQNSDDAQSTAVEIHFNRSPNKTSSAPDVPLPDLKTTPVYQWTFRNNGISFRDEDWNRLKKIAEGNPDEEKIGAFGVGFYSLFSVTEEPFVRSGGQWMGFYWKDKKDQLFARRGQLSEESPWTSFEMVLREPAPMPPAFDFARFLASSITFMSHLSEVTVFFEDKRLVKLTKSVGLCQDLTIPKSLQRSSRLGIMHVRGLKSTSMDIKAEVMRGVYSVGSEKPPPPTSTRKPVKPTSSHSGFFSVLFGSFSSPSTPDPSPPPLPPISEPEPDLLAVNETRVSLSIYSAELDVRLDKKISNELYRSTKKNPPTRLKYELIYTSKDAYDASKQEDESLPFATGSVFQGLRADLDGTGAARIFIGHATGQTTGIAGHMSSRFIPTVERESIDLMDRNVAIWNRELLFVGGFVARATYEIEMNSIQILWESAGSDVGSELQSWLLRRSIHSLNFFTIRKSTPSEEVAALLEAAFFSCGPAENLQLMSTNGVRNACDIRVPDVTFAGFLKHLPVLPDGVMKEAESMVRTLRQRDIIKDITFEDVLVELRSRPLTEPEMVACMRWWTGLNNTGTSSRLLHIRAELLNAAVFTTGTPGTPDEKNVPLSSVRTFLNPRTSIPPEGPLPDHLLPLSISKEFTPDALAQAFSWTELTILQWLQHICSQTGSSNVEFDLNLSAPWAERVLTSLIRPWPTLSTPTKGEIVKLLSIRTCIPTSAGLKQPNDSYFSNANVFRDLPIVTFASGAIIKGPLERLLQDLGVRKHVDLQVVFNRMIKTNEWTIAELIKYLVNVRSTLTSEEWTRLQMTSAFSKEDGATADGLGSKHLKRYQAKELYEPLDVFRQMGLPLIDWGAVRKWRPSSEEAKFLFDLGLLRYPPLETLVSLCASSDTHLRSVALKYLIDNMNIKYKEYDPRNFSHIAFVPALKGGQAILETPTEVYSNPEWAGFGLSISSPVITAEMASKLKVEPRPAMKRIVAVLKETPPKEEVEARKWFGILAGQLANFQPGDLKNLSNMAIVPVRGLPQQTGEKAAYRPQQPLKWLAPSQCFFGMAGPTGNLHSKLFVFIDFGPLANNFLTACGAKREPSVEELAQMLLADPHKFYDLTEGPTEFLEELRNLAVNSKLISSATLTRMKRAPVLLGLQRKITRPEKTTRSEKGSGDPLDDDEWEWQYDLKKADEIVVADDSNTHQLFGDKLFCAPQEDILEGFYLTLGSRRLSSLLKQDYQTSAEIKNYKGAADLRVLILERLPLFLHEHTHAKTRFSYNWLTTEGNFIVRTFGKLTVQKSLHWGNIRESKIQEATAVSKRFGYGPIELWIAGNTQLDLYEVATSLNRLLFESAKANDALLFSTILSTDLRSLKRRGYNVDRILRQQQTQREAALQATRAKDGERETLISKSPSRTSSREPAQVSATPAAAAPVPDVLDAVKARPSSTVMSSFQKLRSKLGGNADGPPLTSDHALDGLAEGPRPIASQLDKIQGATPRSNISSNIDMAVNACRPESGNLLRNREEMRQVQESLNEGYCDISGRAGDLVQVGSLGAVKVYLDKDSFPPGTEREVFVTKKHEPLSRLAQIMGKLAEVYNLPLTSLHIFHDLQGGLIAFNRNGSIFLNFRYFEAWHDEEVARGQFNSALISWYFTLAHEIAHNLVQPHNSEHEFYFSAICEKHLMALGRILSPQ